jgi:hypothetical protein
LAIVDENFSNLSIQAGGKWFAHKNLMLQSEFNQLKRKNTDLLFHYNESFTTPFAENHSELVGIITYKKNRWLTRGVLNTIFSDLADIQSLDVRQAFIINPSFNFTFHIGLQIRNASKKEGKFVAQNSTTMPITFGNSNVIYIGLSTNLQNLYFNY